MMGPSAEEDPVFKSLIHIPNSEVEKNLFLDIRDCTGKPMVWSNEIMKNEMGKALPSSNLSSLAQNVLLNTRFSKL